MYIVKRIEIKHPIISLLIGLFYPTKLILAGLKARHLGILVNAEIHLSSLYKTIK